MKRLFFFVLLLNFGPAVLAQTAPDSATTPPDPDRFYRSFIVTSGYAFSSTSFNWFPHLRQSLAASGIQTGATWFNGVFPIGFAVRFRRFKVGLDVLIPGLRASLNTGNTNQTTPSVRGWSGTSGLHAGYAVWQTRNYWLFLNLGAGVETAEALVTRSGQGAGTSTVFGAVFQPSTTFAGELVPLRRESGYSEISLEWMNREKRRRTVNFSFRTGYRFGLASEPWQFNSVVLSGAPTDRMAQFFVQGTLALVNSRERQADHKP